MIFLDSVSSAVAPVFYLPGVCTHTDTEGKQGKTRVRNIRKSLEKTQYLMNTLYIWEHSDSFVFISSNLFIRRSSRKINSTGFSVNQVISLTICYLFISKIKTSTLFPKFFLCISLVIIILILVHR